MKNIATAYAARRFSRGGRIKTRPEPSEVPMGKEIMCEHGGEALCNAGCYADGGEVEMGIEGPGMLQMEDDNIGMASRKGYAHGGVANPKLQQSHMFEGGDLSLEDDEEEGIEPSGDNDDDMRAEHVGLGSNENEFGEDLENKGAKKFAKGGMMKSKILHKILGGISKYHRGM